MGVYVEEVCNSKPRVDRDKHKIYGVKICGNKSANGRYYGPMVLESARHHYEGAPVFIDHPPQGKADSRLLRDYFGALEACRVQDGELWGDLDYRPASELADWVVEQAEGGAPDFGLSHSAVVEFDAESSGVVKSIVAVRSVDIVNRPATTKSLFEAEDTVEIEALKAELQLLKNKDLARSILESEKITPTVELLEAMVELSEESMRKLVKCLPHAQAKPTSVALEPVLEEVCAIKTVDDFIKAVKS